MKQAIMIYTNQQPQSLEIEASLKDKLELAGFRLVDLVRCLIISLPLAVMARS